MSFTLLFPFQCWNLPSLFQRGLGVWTSITFPSHMQLTGHFPQESAIDLHTAERSTIFPFFVFLYLLWICSDQLSGEFLCTCAPTLCLYNNLKLAFPCVAWSIPVLVMTLRIFSDVYERAICFLVLKVVY